MTQSRKRRKLIRSCILLCLLYFTMEALYFAPPLGSDTTWYGTVQFLTRLFLGVPAVYFALPLSILQGMYYAHQNSLLTREFIGPLIAVTFGCIFNALMVIGTHRLIHGFFGGGPPYWIALLPPFLFTLGGILMHICMSIQAHFRK